MTITHFYILDKLIIEALYLYLLDLATAWHCEKLDFGSCSKYPVHCAVAETLMWTLLYLEYSATINKYCLGCASPFQTGSLSTLFGCTLSALC